MMLCCGAMVVSSGLDARVDNLPGELSAKVMPWRIFDPILAVDKKTATLQFPNLAKRRTIALTASQVADWPGECMTYSLR
jgi:hypothetical protein